MQCPGPASGVKVLQPSGGQRSHVRPESEPNLPKRSGCTRRDLEALRSGALLDHCDQLFERQRVTVQEPLPHITADLQESLSLRRGFDTDRNRSALQVMRQMNQRLLFL